MRGLSFQLAPFISSHLNFSSHLKSFVVLTYSSFCIVLKMWNENDIFTVAVDTTIQPNRINIFSIRFESLILASQRPTTNRTIASAYVVHVCIFIFLYFWCISLYVCHLHVSVIQMTLNCRFSVFVYRYRIDSLSGKFIKFICTLAVSKTQTHTHHTPTHQHPNNRPCSRGGMYLFSLASELKYACKRVCSPRHIRKPKIIELFKFI